MGNFFESVKTNMTRILKRAGKTVVRALLPIILLILIAVILIGGLIKELTTQDGSYKEGDMSNVPYASTKYTADVTIDADGKITTSMTAKELWEEMTKNNSRVEEYLDGPEDLLKLMNAEIITNYPDTRPDPDADIDWKKLNKNIDSNEAQGIIKFKRAKDDGNTVTMKYVNSKTFYEWIEQYNMTGDEDIKQKILEHFTIEKKVGVSGNTIQLNYNGKDIITDISEAILKAAQETGPSGPGLCQAWVRQVYTNAGLPDVGYIGAYQAFQQTCVSTDVNNIPIGAAVYGTGSASFNGGPNIYGHVGIYVGDIDGDGKGDVMDNISDSNGNGIVSTQSLESWIQWQVNAGNTACGGTPGWLGWGWQSGAPTKILSGGSNNTNNNQTNNQNNNKPSSGSSNNMQLITDNGKVTFYNGDGSAMEGGKDNALGYALSEGQVAMKNLSQYKNSVIYIETSQSGEGSYANGKYFYVTDTGGGLADNQVDVYANVDQPTLNAEPYGSYSSGAKIYLVEENVTIDEYNSKYLNKTSNTVNSSNTTTNTTSKYNVVVGTWREKYEERVAVGAVDPEGEYIDAGTTYTMTTQKIDYQNMVSGYTMPFDYLWALIVTGRDKDFAINLADLVYESEIEITVHDNYTKTTDIDTYNYTRKTKVHTHDIKVTGSWRQVIYGPDGIPTTISGDIDESDAQGDTDEILKPYTIKHTIITKTNTLDVSLTKANVWIVDYKKEYKYEAPGAKVANPVTSELTPIAYPATPDNSDNGDPCGIGAAFESSVRKNYRGSVSTNMTCKSDYYYGFEGTVTNENTVETKKYTSSPAQIIEKTDKHSKEDNFVTLFIKNYNSRNNILSAPEWLFEILGTSEKTVDMIDLTKYLFYKATGRDYGVTEYDFSAFDPKNFKNVTTGIYGGTVEEKVWFALRDAGYSEYAVAGAMGNIYAESGFDPAIIEHGTGIGFGLCQWSFGRRNQIEAYAQSKGVPPSDVNTQIEFLISELTPGGAGPAQGYANYQLLSYNGYNGDMWINATSPEDAATAFCWSFERPGAPRLDVRQNKAREYYEEFKGRTKPTGASADSILNACEEVMQEFLNRNARYSTSNIIWGDIERFWKDGECLCCASYVSMVLYRSGALTPAQINAYNYNYTGSGGVSDMLQAAGWQQVAETQAQPGDVVVDYNVHAMIYAGNGKVWDQASCVVSSKGNPPTRGVRSYNISGCQIWRAP